METPSIRNDPDNMQTQHAMLISWLARGQKTDG